MKKIGVDIIQPIVPHYRKPLFEGLACCNGLEISIQCAAQWPKGYHSIHLDIDHYFPDRIIKSLGGTSLLWQSGLKLIHAKGPGDVLVICGDLHYLSNLPLIHQARAKGIGIVWWGHHWSASTNKRLFPYRLKFVQNLADCFLLYTRTGVETWVKYGFSPERLFYTGNSIDFKPIEESLLRWSPERLKDFQVKNNIHPNTILFTSVLNPKVHLDIAFRAMAELNDLDFEFVVIGDGPMRSIYDRIARELGISHLIRWLGEIRDEDRLAPWFLSAKTFVYPGSIGLSLLHAFAYGLPVITHDNREKHMPEIEAFIPETNGLAFIENDPHSLAAQLRVILQDDLLRKSLSNGAHAKAKEYDIERMIERFNESLLYCSEFSLRRAQQHNKT